MEWSRIRGVVAGAFFGLVFVCGTAKADMSSDEAIELLDKKDTKEAMEIYFSAMLASFESANLELQVDHKEKLFCVPPKLRLSDKRFIGLYKSFYSKNPDLHIYGSTRLGIATLRHHFPCNVEK